ncbi:MAG: M1 family peptidase, partial [Jiangellaceae bacterium]
MGRTRSCRIALRAGVVGLVLVGLTATPATAQEFTPGSPGLGDPYFPLAGNGGYDVGHYALDFSYDPSTRR